MKIGGELSGANCLGQVVWGKLSGASCLGTPTTKSNNNSSRGSIEIAESEV